MEVVVTGIGLISALGSLQETWHNLSLGKTGIAVSRPFSELPPLPLGLIEAAPLALIPLVQMVIRAALKDAAIHPPLPDCGIVIGSSRSQQSVWEGLIQEQWHAVDHGVNPPVPSQLSLVNWLDTLPHRVAIVAAHDVGATGPVLAPMAACATGLVAIAQGFELLQTGQCQQVLVGAVEAPITPLTLTGFRQMGAMASTGSYPFDVAREGLVLGEGGAVLLLETAESAATRQASIYGRVLGFGMTADAYHISTPEPNGRGAIVAVQQCLQRSQLAPNQVQYIHAHGTATEFNDRQEARLIQHLFPADVLVSSTKGATGHTLGASGAMGAAFCLLALKEQHLPPCVGLNKAAFDLNLLTAARSALVNQVLCFSFGFGGQNVVVALGR
ncbi:3-oxoacyl-ACP synthase [Leptolyngbya sp. 'hensonii']|nr:3-oxoacyl-ACP synthase [Leptolyngbya sp. 'hensonii']